MNCFCVKWFCVNGGGVGVLMIGGLMTLLICVRGLTRESIFFLFFNMTLWCPVAFLPTFSCHMLIILRLAFKLQIFIHFNITITICTYTYALAQDQFQ
jgi:hypothetical protein